MFFQKGIGICFVLFSFFPYVSPIRNDFDSQPFSLVLGSLFILISMLTERYNIKKMYPLVWFSLIAIILIFINVLIYDLDMETFRAIANYSTLSIIPIAFYIYMSKYGFPYGLFKMVIFIYLIVALLQVTYGKDIFEFLVSARTSLDRGVTSLAPEPTYYGIICYFFLILIGLLKGMSKKEKILYSMLLMFQIVFLAKSSMVFLFLFFYLISLPLYFKSMKYFIVELLFILLLFLMLSFISQYVQGSRLEHLITSAMNSGYKIFYFDASLNERLSQVFFSFYGLFQNYLLPGLFSTFQNITENRTQVLDGFFWYGNNTNKIMSFWGAICYEMGFISIFYIMYFYKYVLKNKIYLFVSLAIPLLAAIPLALPITHLFIAVRISQNEKN